MDYITYNWLDKHGNSHTKGNHNTQCCRVLEALCGDWLRRRIPDDSQGIWIYQNPGVPDWSNAKVPGGVEVTGQRPGASPNTLNRCSEKLGHFTKLGHAGKEIPALIFFAADFIQAQIAEDWLSASKAFGWHLNVVVYDGVGYDMSKVVIPGLQRPSC